MTPPESRPQPAISADVVVYGATAGGVAAAVAAAEAGASVILLEPGRHVGGMTSGGLGYTDVGDVRVIGGMAARLRSDVAAWYGVPVGTYAGPEPRVAEAIFRRWLEQAGVTLVQEALLSRVETRDGRILHLEDAQGRTYAGGVFVDSSYEGDLMAGAGVPYAVGREDRSLYGETFAGRREIFPGRHNFPDGVSPFLGDPEGLVAGELLPQLRTTPMVDVGQGDGGVMSYGYRLCLTTAPDRIPFDRTDTYDEAYWELGRRLFHHWAAQGIEPPVGSLLGLEPNLPGGKADGNSLGPLSLSVLDGSAWEYPDASPERREEIRRHHRNHARDFLTFLRYDKAVPESVRRGIERWGLPAEEFADTDHLPHQLYVREARRMLGQVVLTEGDLRTARTQPDVVAMGSYHLDIREVQRNWRWVYEHPRPLAMIVTEGYLSVPVPAYPIPYRALLPQPEDCRNLIVSVCVSASHVAFSSIRMEPQYMMLGHAAGLAAATAATRGVEPSQVDVSALQEKLRDQGQILAL